MANDERIGVIIETELQGNATEQATAKLKEFEKTAAKTATAVDKSFAAMSKSQQKVSKSTKELSGTVVNANGAMVSFGRIIQDAPFGIIGVGNNITQLTEQFAILRAQSGSTGAALSALGTSILGPAGLLSIGISSIITLWTLYSQRQQQAASETKKLAEETKSLVQVLNESRASVQGQVETAKELGRILLDTNKGYDQRKAALNELKKLNKEYFRDLDIEKSNLQEIKLAVDRYADSLVRAATIKGLQESISKTAEELSKITPVINKGLKDLAKLPSPFDAFVEKQDQSANRGAFQLQGAFNRIDSILVSGGKRLAADIANVGDIQQQAIAGTAPLDQLRQRLRDFTDALSEALSGTDTPDADKKAKDVKTLADVIKELNNELAATDAIAQATGRAFDDLGKDKIQAFEKAIKSLIDIGIQPSNAIFREFQTRIEEIQRFIAKQQLPQAGNIIVTATPVFELGRPSTTTLRGLEDSFRPILDLFNTKAKEIFKTGFADAIEGAFAGLGEAIASGGNVIGNVLSGFINGISGMLAQLGRLLIAQGVALEAFKNSLRTLQGFQAIIAGGALILAAAAFRSFANKGIGSFATGGTAVGTQLAVVGDNSSRREHILSDMQLQKIAGSGNTQLELTTRLVGTDLWLLIQRVAKEQLRR